MKIEEMIERLELFNRGASEIDKVKFSEEYRKKISAKTNFETQETTYKAPSDIEIKAYCNDIRKFIQKNDLLKIERLQEVYQSNIVPQDCKDMYNQTMSQYERIKKIKPPYLIFPLPEEIRDLENHQIFDLFMYGNIVHYSKNHKEKVEIYQRIEKMPFIFSFLKLQFIRYVDDIWYAISNLFYVNKLVLKHLKKWDMEE